MIIPNKINPIGTSTAESSFRFTLIDDGWSCQYLTVDGQIYAIRNHFIFGDSVGNPTFQYDEGHIFIGYDKQVVISYSLACNGDYCRVYSSEDESKPIYEVIHDGSGKPDKFTLPNISPTAYYILKFACMD